MIEAIIVDDEINARENLRYLLDSFCKQITVVGEASNVDDAESLIKNLHPKVVFLDIEMPKKNGFKLLEICSDIDFQVVFVTAYDQYAIKAFRVSAIDYLLKPIEIELLQEAVKKIEHTLQYQSTDKRIQALKDNSNSIQKLAIPYKSDYAILNVDDVLCIEADRMYSKIYTLSNKQFLVAKKLRHYEELLKQNNFVRVHRSWIVQLYHIHSYSKKERSVLLKNNITIPVSKTFKDALEHLLELN